MESVLLTGGHGFLGERVFEILNNKYKVIRFRSSECDLRDSKSTLKYFKNIKPDFVIHMAARLGGIGDNQKNPAFYFEDNILIGINVMKSCALIGVKKLINIGTVCSYPKDLSTPFNEDDVWNGFPEGTNSAYGIAKRALFSYSQALNKQYNLNTTNLLLANLYGPGDDFREETSHVIPSKNFS